MPRPTPARLFYLFIGLILGVVAAVVVSQFVLPGILASLPFVGQSAAPASPGGPTQFTGSQLERVVPLNQAQDKNAVVVRLNSLEIYRDGFGFTYAVISGRGGVSPQTLEPETFQVVDDRGTAYTISPVASGTILSAGFTTGIASFTPAPPTEARILRVTVPNVLAVGLRLREGQPRVSAGPWEFQLPLK